MAPDGRFVFGLDRDAKESAKLVALYRDGTGETRTLAVKRRAYDIQRIEGLPPKMVEPDPKELPRIKREYEMIVNARKVTTRAPSTTARNSSGRRRGASPASMAANAS